jgi:hypothetical protein
MKPLIYRQSRLFKIEESELPTKAKTTSTKNALYAAIYDEFTDAQYNPKYEKLSLVERMQAINDFARNWLKEKGFI